MLMEYNTQDIIEFIMSDLNIDYYEAMKLFYSLETFEKLYQIETGLYLESATYVYGIFQDERNFGKIVQAEI